MMIRAYQKVQKRTRQTAAVVNGHVPALTIGLITVSSLCASADHLDELARDCDKATVDARQARQTAIGGFRELRDLVLRMPHVAKNELCAEIPEEEVLLALLPAIFAITPRTPALAAARARLVISAMEKINAYLASLAPPRPPLSAGGRGIAELSKLLDALPALAQARADAENIERTARSSLRTATRTQDRLNKRFYCGLRGEARVNASLAAALGQIEAEKPHRRPTSRKRRDVPPMESAPPSTPR